MMLNVGQKASAQSPASIEKYKLKTDSLLKNYGQVATFALKGKVNNLKSSYIDFDISDYFKSKTVSLMLKKDGSFEQNYIVNGTQQIYLFLDDWMMRFTVAANDTLMLNWDQKDLKKTFTISSTDPYRDAILKTELALIQKTQENYINLLNFELNQQKNPSSAVQKYNSINAVYNKAVAVILQEEKKYPDLVKKIRSPFADLLANQYFIYTNILLDKNLLFSRPLKITDTALINPLKNTQTIQGRTVSFYAIRYWIVHNWGIRWPASITFPCHHTDNLFIII